MMHFDQRAMRRIALSTAWLLGFGASLLETTATQAATCTVGMTDVAFGVYNPFSATPTDTTATLSAACTTTLPVETISASIVFSKGNAGVFSPRNMNNLPDVLQYNIFADAARSVIIGDGTAGTVRYVWNPTITPGPGVSGSATVYGRAPASQNVGPGSYNDLLTVTFTY